MLTTNCTPLIPPSVPAPGRLRVPRGGLTVGARHYRPGALIADTPANRAALAELTGRAARVGPIVLGCKGADYLVEPLPVDPSIGQQAYLVSDPGRTKSYAVLHDVDGETTCECPHFVYRLAGTGGACKHVGALVAAGLVAPTRPRDAAEPAEDAPVSPAAPADGVQPLIAPAERFRLEADPRPGSLLATFARTPAPYQVVRGAI